MKNVSLNFTEEQTTVLYFALNLALINIDHRIEELIKKNYRKNLDVINALQQERHEIRQVQLTIPDSAIKI